MSNSTSQVRNLVSTGVVKTTGGNRNIAPGSLAVVDKMKSSPGEGLDLVSNFAAYEKDDPRFILMVGEKETASARTSVSHDSSTQPFSINQVVSVGVSTPKNAQVKVDELRFGYDGHDPSTSIKLKQGMQPMHIRFELSEGSIPFSGGGTNREVVDLVYDFNESNAYNACSALEACEDINCKPVIEDIVKYIQRREISGGRKVGDIVDVFPISSCAGELGEDPFTTFEISVTDTGDSNALAAVQANYSSKVTLYKRRGSTSIYRTLVEGMSTPTAFTPTVAGMLPVCNVCENGEDLSDGGFAYYFTADDAGADVSSTIKSEIESEVSGSTATVEKQGNDFGKGVYSVVVDEQVSWNAIQDIVQALAEESTPIVATVKELGELTKFCAGETLDPISWTSVETCYATTKEFKISLGDTDCEGNKLEALRASYPELDINIVANTSAEVTLSGASGTGNITINGVDTLVTFDTDLGTTAGNVATAGIEGFEVTADGEVLTIVGEVTGDVVFTNLTGDLAGAVEAEDLSTGCMHTYKAVAATNIQCDECDDAFIGLYEAETPSPFAGTKWEEINPVAESTDCLCGFGIRGKLFKITPEKSLRDKLEYLEDSVRIVGGAAGYKSRGYLDDRTDYSDEIKVIRVSEKLSRDQVAGNLICAEMEGGYYFQDTKTHWRDSLKARWVDLESRFSDLDAQYINYWIKINHSKLAGHFDQQKNKTIIYNVMVEVGKQDDIEGILNAIASAKGISGVKAY